ncbi:hypothetical protein E4U21_003258 [Claviceps maximensis]|nr:hypothetical protein E4U21_003258 [Claviceps maximensis]
MVRPAATTSLSLLTTVAVLVCHAGLARCLDVSVDLYTSPDCKTRSTVTPRTALSPDTCVVTPGLVSLHYDSVPCAGGGSVVPYLFKDALCTKKQSALDFYKTGSDLLCLSDFAPGAIAAVMMSCNRGRRQQPPVPAARTTVTVGEVATDANAATSTPSFSSSAAGAAATPMIPPSTSSAGTGGGPRDDTDRGQSWQGLSRETQTGIIVTGGVAALAICVGLCLWLMNCMKPPSPPRPPPPPPPPAATVDCPRHPLDAASPYDASWNSPIHTAIQEIAPPVAPSHHLAYLQLLDNVVHAARRHAATGFLDNASSHAPDDTAPGDDAVPVHVLSAALSRQDPDWKHKLGAAGELYMFEYLKSLRLPHFGPHNWKSSLRTRVAAYPGYQGMDHTRDGIADLEYFDEHGILTEFLLARGYSAQGIRGDMRPTYRFEVKATTSTDWRAPFYMSGKQEEHIRDAHITTCQPDEVYILCRIFGLGTGSRTRLSIYLDPEARRREGRLHFSRNIAGEDGSWIVQPV